METSVNNKCKAFTSLEQSRKLAEILPLESAKCDSITLATKEQRDTLFAKMKEAGYAFDFKKKELKKLGQSEVTKTSDQEL